jgi:hypothetical protein
MDSCALKSLFPNEIRMHASNENVDPFMEMNDRLRKTNELQQANESWLDKIDKNMKKLKESESFRVQPMYVTLRLVLETTQEAIEVKDQGGSNQWEVREEPLVSTPPLVEPCVKNVKELVSEPHTIPFPSKIIQSQVESELKEIKKRFEQISINIPLLEAITQIPTYGKVLRECCRKKRKRKVLSK